MAPSPRLALVSAVGCSAFMVELLEVIADAINRAGGDAFTHRGQIAEVLDEGTVAVVIPHEYLALHPQTPEMVLRRTIGFGVEHPGTQTFSDAAAVVPRFGGWSEINPESVAALRRGGAEAMLFPLGYSPLWDRSVAGRERDIDVVHLGTADETRLRKMALLSGDLAGLRTEIILAPHEPMTRPRPDFLMGEAKWDLLARSALMLNLHRESSTAFEWVRALEAISNGCVVLTEPSTALAPLVPGKHLLVGRTDTLGRIARSALRDPEWLAAIGDRARELCRTERDMTEPALGLISLAERVAENPCPPAISRPEAGRRRTSRIEPLAMWVPQFSTLPSPTGSGDSRAAALIRELRWSQVAAAQPTVVRPEYTTAADWDLLCVQDVGDGPIRGTTDSVAAQAEPDFRISAFLGACGPWPGLPVGPTPDPTVIGAAAVVSAGQRSTRGRIRNLLLSQGCAEFVLVLDAGDELLPGAIALLRQGLAHHPQADIIYPMATLGSSTVVNALLPESRRLARFDYLSRGYLVRRRLLTGLGGFVEDPALDGLVDHDFWLRACAQGAQGVLLPSIGLRLWPQKPPPSLADYDPAAVADLLVANTSGA